MYDSERAGQPRRSFDDHLAVKAEPNKANVRVGVAVPSTFLAEAMFLLSILRNA